MLELRCPSCPCHFSAAPSTPYSDVLDRMIDEGPWFGLAEGKTFEDMIFAALAMRGSIRCPECSEAVVVGEQSMTETVLEGSDCC
jgi:hypothetical protein